MSEERLSDVVCDIIALYESSIGKPPDVRLRIFDRIPEVCQRAIRPEDRARLAGDPPPMPLGQTSWIEDVA